MDKFFSIEKESKYELVVKKSKFIANAYYVENEKDAEEKIKAIKRKYYDARHNCYAYKIMSTEKAEYKKCSDDGEPSGTAGRPMLDVILGEDIYNVAVVVTRYFGGVLLGTGGLVRAYSKAVQEGFRESRIIEKKHGICLTVTTDYTGIGKIQYIAGERGIPVLGSEYTDKVVMKLLIPSEDVDSVQKAVTEGTNGRAIMEKEKELYFSTVDGQLLTFETES